DDLLLYSLNRDRRFTDVDATRLRARNSTGCRHAGNLAEHDSIADSFAKSRRHRHRRELVSQNARHALRRTRTARALSSLPRSGRQSRLVHAQSQRDATHHAFAVAGVVSADSLRRTPARLERIAILHSAFLRSAESKHLATATTTSR